MVVLRERILNLVPLYSLVCGMGGSVVVDVFNPFPTVHVEIRFCSMLPFFGGLSPQQGYLTPNDLKNFNPSSHHTYLAYAGVASVGSFHSLGQQC